MQRPSGERIGSGCGAPIVRWELALIHVPSARWLDELVPGRKVVLRTNSITAQLNAAEAGLGVAPLSDAYRNRRALTAVRLAPDLRGSLPPLPRQSLWLVGHRATRDVPRIAAVWETILNTLGLRVRKARSRPA